MKTPISAHRSGGATGLMYIATALAFLALAGLSLLRHLRLESEEDLAMFDQMLWSVRQGLGLVTSISGNVFLQFPHHFFGEHVSPILYLLAWPAGLTRGPEALLVIQALAVIAAAFPLQRLTETLTGSVRLGVAAALVWLLLPALWTATLYDFHMEAFEAFFLFSFALAFLRGNWTAWLWGVLYAACKEDAPIYLSALAFMLGWCHGRFRTGFVMAAAAGLYAIAAVLWIGPAFSPTDAPLLQSRLLTPSFVGGVWPWIHLVLLHGQRWQHLIQHLLVMGLLPALGGFLLVPAALAVGIMWLSSADPQALITLHYPLTLYPPLAIAAVAGLARASRFLAGLRYPALRPIALSALVALTALSLAYRWRAQLRIDRDIRISYPLLFEDTYRDARQALAAIPADERVAARPSLAAHVSRRSYLVLILNGRDERWLALRLDGIAAGANAKNYYAWLDRLLGPGSDYGVAAQDGQHVVILHRGAATDQNAAAKASPRSMEGEDLEHEMGVTVIDPLALNGRAWQGRMKQTQHYLALGPDLQLEPGAYRVGFRVRTARFTPGRMVQFSVTEGTNNTVLGSTQLDRNTQGYEWINVDVNVRGTGDVQFRCWKGHRGVVWLDTVRWQRIN